MRPKLAPLYTTPNIEVQVVGERKLKYEEVVHHKDENKSNDCLYNLELVSQEVHNTLHKLGTSHTLGARQQISSGLQSAWNTGRRSRGDGVCLRKGRYVARVTFNGVRHFIGSYTTHEDAVRARNIFLAQLENDNETVL